MALQVQLANGSLIGGGGGVFLGENVHVKPIDYGSFGHYRAVGLVTLAAGQAAGARLFELRNSSSNLIIPTSIEVTALPIGAVAVPYLLILALYRCTAFSAVDTTNATTVAASPMRTSMPAAPGGVQIRQASSVAAGMTGGTLTKDAAFIGLFTAWMASVSATTKPVSREFVRPNGMAHPLILASNEGLLVENAAVGSATANNMIVTVDISYAEVPVNGY